MLKKDIYMASLALRPSNNFFRFFSYCMEICQKTTKIINFNFYIMLATQNYERYKSIFLITLRIMIG